MFGWGGKMCVDKLNSKQEKMIPGEFRCRRCGDCCRWTGHVLLTEGDIQCLSAELKLTEEAFIDSYTCLARNRRQLSLTEKENGECIFLNGDKCRVYNARPHQCRSYPAEWRVSDPCRGFNRSRSELS